MNYILVLLAGAIVSTMNIFNGQLSDYCGVYLSTVIVHLVGLITFIIMMLIKKQRIFSKNNLPILMYTGGAVGVLTVLFTALSISTVGAALLTALTLLGQLIVSIILELTGLFDTVKRKPTPMQVVSLVIICIGIGVMII